MLGAGLPVALHVAATALLAWASSGTLAAVRSPGTARLDDLLALSAALAGWGVLTWLTVGLLVTVAAARHGGGTLERLALAITPGAVRRAAGLLLGLSLAGAPTVALPAGAVTGAPPASVTAGVAAGAGDPDRPVTPPAVPPRGLAGWTPDRPAPPPKPQVGAGSVGLVTTTPRGARAVAQAVVVRRGDTLWDIAARHLGPDASPAEVAAEWPRWYAANRATIGPDPGLIRPGQRLQPPAR